MKNLLKGILFTGGMFLLTVIPCLAQEQVASITQLKEQIATMEAIERDPSTPYDVKDYNRKFLAERRTRLHTQLVKRIDALRKYQMTISSSLTPDEIQTIERSIAHLEADLRRFKGTPNHESALESVAGNAPINLIASTEPVSIPVINTSSVRTSSSLSASEASSAVSARGCTISIVSPPVSTYRAFNQQAFDIVVDVTPRTCTKKVRVKVENDFSTIYEQTADVEAATGRATIKGVKIGKGDNAIRVMDDEERSVYQNLAFTCDGDGCGKGTTQTTAAAEGAANKDLPDVFSSLYSRAGVGFEQAGAAAASSTQKFMLEFFWNPPLKTGRRGTCPAVGDPKRALIHQCLDPTVTDYEYNDLIHSPISAWANVRFASIPQQLSDPLSTFSSSFLTPISGGKVNELVQGFDFLAGLEFSFGRGTEAFTIGGIKQRVALSFIIGGGAINPLSPKSSAQIFAINDDVRDRFGATRTAGKTYIAFVQPDVDRFTRQYYGGLRLKTFFYENDGYTPKNRPPAIFDVTIGQNELVTGGRLHGMVLRLDGFYPFPFSGASFVYLYGTANLKLSRKAVFNDPLILATAPSTVTIPSPDVLIVTSDPSNRDFYRIGVGLNIFDMINKIRGGAKPAAAAGTP